MNRVAVAKTYKLYINGAYPRSEAGRVVPVNRADGEVLARVAQASRKDLRDAVKAARHAQPGWGARTGYNRGQILYRMAEVLESRSETMASILELTSGPELGTEAAADEVSATIDRLVWYAGWCDKYAQVAGNANPVAGPFFNISVPEPSGVVGLVAPLESALLPLVSRLSPALVTGNTTVVVVAPEHAMAAITLAEIIDASDVPAGVINILTGYATELVPWMAGHREMDVVDLAGADDELTATAGLAAADSVTRVVAGPSDGTSVDWFSPQEQSPELIGFFTEIKTVWHPKGT